jgi:hypothetical protein
MSHIKKNLIIHQISMMIESEDLIIMLVFYQDKLTLKELLLKFLLTIIIALYKLPKLKRNKLLIK